MARIGFIGLGNMGAGMAANLAAAGHEVRAFDIAEAALERAREAGCTPVASAADAATDAACIVTMLPAGEHVRSVYEDQLFDAMPGHALLIDCSTIGIAAARTIGAAVATRGLAMVDAPVSGGIAASKAGTLTFMVGGTDEAFARAEPILSAMGKTVIHAGPFGTGQAVKICNNLMLGVTMVATCEAFLLAEKLGLDRQMLFEIASKASGQSWSLTSYCPVPSVGPVTPADNDYQSGFAAVLQLKDLKLAVAAAQEAEVSVPMTGLAESLYQAMVNAGGGTRDFSAMIRFLEGRL